MECVCGFAGIVWEEICILCMAMEMGKFGQNKKGEDGSNHF